MIVESSRAEIRESSPLTAVARSAVRRGASVAPLGTIVGAALGLAGDGSETMSSADTALLLAAVLGFGLTPMLASIVSIARGVNGSEPELAHPLLAGTVLSIALSVAWVVLAALVALAAASLVALDLNATRLLISALIVAVAGGAILGTLATGLVRVARGRARKG